MTNGDRLTGTIEAISNDTILLVTEHSGTLRVQTPLVASIDADRDFSVRVNNQTITGQLAPAESGNVTIGDQAVAIAEIQSASEDRLALVVHEPDWASRADLTAVISNGNSDTQNVNALLESVYKKDTVEHAVSLLLSNEKAEDETTKDTVDFDYGYKRFISEKWFASGHFEYFKDALKDIDARYTLDAGMGYQFWDNSLGGFSTDVGIGYVREDLDGESENNPAVRWGIAWNRYLLAKQLELFHKQSILYIPDSDRGEVLSSSTGMRYALSERVDATARADVIHETEPVPGNSKTDVTYTIGVGIKF